LGAPPLQRTRHCERSEAIQNLSARIFPPEQSGLLRSARNDGVWGTGVIHSTVVSNRRHTIAISRPVPPEFCFLASPSLKQGRREGRAPAGTRDPCAGKNAHGLDHRSANRPAFPARWFTAYFALSPGSDALLPPSPCGWLMRASGRASHITTRLDAQTPGVRTTRLRRPRTSSLGRRELARARSRHHAKTLSAPCRHAKAIAHGQSRPATLIAPDAVASIAPQPAVRDDRDPPLVSGQGALSVRQIRSSVK
jgi:hypothetical protein